MEVFSRACSITVLRYVFDFSLKNASYVNEATPSPSP